MPQHPRSRSALVGIAVMATVLATASSPNESLACAFHDDVTLARGILNWVYPDALHVVGAISTAVAEGRLPPSNAQTAAPDPFGGRYRAAVRSLERFGDALRAAPEEALALPLSLLLIEPMLWTRFDGERGELHAQVHVSGPQPGDLVLVSGEDVIREVTNGRLSIGEAYRVGLIRLYGSDDHRARFLAAYTAARAKHQATPVEE